MPVHEVKTAEKNNLEIVSISCMTDDGIFVVFKEKG